MANIYWTRPALEQLNALLAPISEQNPEMGASISSRIEEGIERLRTFPESAPIHESPVRRLSIHNLPYSCYYEWLEGVITIVAIRHDKQQSPVL